MSLKYIQKGKLYDGNKNYNFEIKEYFTTISKAREFIEQCKEGEYKTVMLDWLGKYDDSTVVQHDYYDLTYHTVCLHLVNGELKHYSGGFGFKTTRRTTNFLNQIYIDEGEAVILKIISNKYSDYIEDIDIVMSYESHDGDEHEEVGEELEGEEHVGSDE